MLLTSHVCQVWVLQHSCSSSFVQLSACALSLLSLALLMWLPCDNTCWETLRRAGATRVSWWLPNQLCLCKSTGTGPQQERAGQPVLLSCLLPMQLSRSALLLAGSCVSSLGNSAGPVKDTPKQPKKTRLLQMGRFAFYLFLLLSC